MGFANGVDTGVVVKNVVAEVFPTQQQHRSQQKEAQLAPAGVQPLTLQPATGQKRWHHCHGVHRPFDGRLPERVTACDDLGLSHGCPALLATRDPYI